jgi:hypothetical protein
MEEIDLSSRNSFLNETKRNEDISSDIRREIDHRFNNSSVNKNYIFPRTKEYSKDFLKHDCILVKKKLKRLVLKKDQSLASVYQNSQPFLRLPEIRQKIRMKSCFKNSTQSLSSSYVFAPKALNDCQPRKISLSKKSFKLRIKSILIK